MKREEQFTKLQECVARGITDRAAIARELGISRPTVYKILAELQERGVDVFALAPVILEEPEPKPVKKKIKPEPDPEEESRKRVKRTTQEIQDNVKQFTKLIDGQANIIEQLNDLNQITWEVLNEARLASKRDWRIFHVVLKSISEILDQNKLAAELMKMLYDSQEIREYQEEVLEVIGSVDPNVRLEIQRRIAERRAARGAIALPGIDRGGTTGAGTEPN